MIRWKFMIPIVIFIFCVGIFMAFFLEGVVKRAIEVTGTKINGAQVDIQDVEISLWELRVALQGLQVTDSEEPMTNSVEIKSLRFDLSPKPLTWKKMVIEEAAIGGIRTHTPRKKSGALPQKKEEKTGKTITEKFSQATSSLLANAKENYDPEKMVRLEDLSSYQKVKEEEARLMALSEAWEARLKALRAEEKIKEMQPFIDKLKNVKDLSLPESVALIEEGRKRKNDLEILKKAFESLKEAVGGEVNQAKNIFHEIDRLGKQDVEHVVSKVKSNFSTEGITRNLLGSVWFEKIEGALGYYHKVRHFFPRKKAGEAAPPQVALQLGQDIPFPFQYAWPRFHLKKASLDGTTNETNPLSYQGMLMDVSSDPQKVGRPLLFEIKGQREGGAPFLELKAALDYVRETHAEKVTFTYGGVNVSGMKLGEMDGPVMMKEARGSLTARLVTEGEKISGQIDFLVDQARLEYLPHPDKAHKKMTEIFTQVLSRLNRLDVSMEVSGLLRSPDFKVRSSLDEQLNAAAREVFQKELEALRGRLRARVDLLVEEARQKLSGVVNEQFSRLSEKLKGQGDLLASVEEEMRKALEKLKKDPLVEGGLGKALEKLKKKSPPFSLPKF